MTAETQRTQRSQRGVPLILYFSLRPLRSLRLCGEFFPNLELGIYVECKRAS